MPQDRHSGASEVFDGTMGAVNTRKVKTLRVIDAAHFTTLTFLFPAGSTSPVPVDPITVASYPPLYEFYDVKTFRIDQGSVEAIYYV